MTAITIELPADVELEVARLAHEEGLSTEQWLAGLASDRVRRARAAQTFFENRRTGADWTAFEAVFGPGRAGGEPPSPGDERG